MEVWKCRSVDVEILNRLTSLRSLSVISEFSLCTSTLPYFHTFRLLSSVINFFESKFKNLIDASFTRNIDHLIEFFVMICHRRSFSFVFLDPGIDNCFIHIISATGSKPPVE